MRQARKEAPFWARRRPQVRLSKSAERRIAKRVASRVPQPHGNAVVPAAYPGSALAAKTGAFRFRRHLMPFEWITALLAAGAILHLPHLIPHAVTWSVITGIAAGVLIVLLSRALSQFAVKAAAAIAFLTALWLPLIAAFGFAKPWPVLLAFCWLAVTIPWVHHYQWRPDQAPAEPDPTDYQTWNALAAEKKWNGHLGTVEELPGGGRRYPVQLDGIKTVIGNVLSASENVAGAWHKPMTEAYAERDPQGITSRGYLTILGNDTLMKIRKWDGSGLDPQSGLARVGRFADSSPLHVKLYTPRYGTRHALVSGTTGSGKTEFLNLLVWVALSSPLPIVPVILDPQEGQSLPFWRDRCLYAAGVDECLAMQAGLEAGMLDRSSYLAGLRWDDEGIPTRGMPFFDCELTGLPIVLPIFDEAHMLLSDTGSKAGQLAVKFTENMGRLGRKTGIALWLATHVPSLADLGGSQALRDMLRGGNVISMRTANAVATGMLGLEKDPSEIPSYFADGKETYGLGYAAGPDNRPDAPMRTDLVPKEMRRNVPAVPQLDDRFAEAMGRAMAAWQASWVATSAFPVPSPVPAQAPSPAASDDDDAPEGRKAADAVLAVLADGKDATRGEIITRGRDLVTGGWGREKPFSTRTIGLALEKLTAANQIIRVSEGIYRLRVLERVK